MKSGKTGINLLLWTTCPTSEHIPLINKIKGYGYDGVELEVTAMSEKDSKILGQEIKDLGMGSTAIAIIPFEEGDPTSSDKATRDKAVEWIKRCADKAKLIGSDVLGGPLTEGLGTPMNSGPTADEINWVAESLNRAAEYTNTIGIKLACEVINRFEVRMANTVEQMMEIVNKTNIPNIGLHVDTHHGNIEETDICSAWEKAGDKIYLVHISENNRGIPGSGPAVKPEIFSTLKEIGYNGWAMVEAFFLNAPDIISSRMRIWRKYAVNEEEIAVKGLAYIRKYW